MTRRETFITIGSPGYSTASERVESEFPVGGRFTADFSGLEIQGHPAIVGTEYSMLVRVTDPATHQTAFYAAGPSIGGSTGAVNHLLASWRTLAKHHRERDYALLLRVNQDGSVQEVIYETSDPFRRRTSRQRIRAGSARRHLQPDGHHRGQPAPTIVCRSNSGWT